MGDMAKLRTGMGLIKNTNGFLLERHVVGNMVFDPGRMCWLGSQLSGYRRC